MFKTDPPKEHQSEMLIDVLLRLWSSAQHLNKDHELDWRAKRVKDEMGSTNPFIIHLHPLLWHPSSRGVGVHEPVKHGTTLFSCYPTSALIQDISRRVQRISDQNKITCGQRAEEQRTWALKDQRKSLTAEVLLLKLLFIPCSAAKLFPYAYQYGYNSSSFSYAPSDFPLPQTHFQSLVSYP